MSKTILIVDDDPLIRKLITTTLQDVAGFDLQEAGDGLAAIEAATIAGSKCVPASSRIVSRAAAQLTAPR